MSAVNLSEISKRWTRDSIRDELKKIDWDKISKEWEITVELNQNAIKTIVLDPAKDCSKKNPLYKHKKWLETVYYNEELNLTDKLISEICGVHLVTIQNWRKIHEISRKLWQMGKWISSKGYMKLLMPKGYLHPELVPIKGRNVRFEHDIVMEKFLIKHPELEWSKKYLIDGKYLITGCNIHHINFDRSDNRLENLYLYENLSEHKKGEKSLFKCFRDLFKLNQIGFKNGKYYLNNTFDCRKLSLSNIKEILKPISINSYSDINLVKEEIKKINWKVISNDWIVKIRKNQILLNPYSDCSNENPLYLHKKWIEHLVYDENFNLSHRRLAKLCGVDRGVIHYWSKVKHNIDMKDEKSGFGKFIHNNRIWIRVPEDYGNAIAERNKGWMYEHRYIIEQYLAKHPEIEWSKKYLIDGKYLNKECIVHHINFDPMDNRLENLWVCKNNKEHRVLETSLTFFVDDLLKSGFFVFKNGKYNLNL